MEKPIANPKAMKASQVIGRIAECQRRLEEAGLSFEDWQAPIDDVEFRRELVEFWQRRGKSEPIAPENPTSHKRAKDIMGDNFLGIEEAQKQRATNEAGMSKAATAGSIAIATGCVAASALGQIYIAVPCVIGGALYTGAVKLMH